MSHNPSHIFRQLQGVHENCVVFSVYIFTSPKSALGCDWSENGRPTERWEVIKEKKTVFFLGRDLRYLLFSWSRSCFLSFFFMVKILFSFLFCWSRSRFLSFSLDLTFFLAESVFFYLSFINANLYVTINNHYVLTSNCTCFLLIQ